MKKTAILIIIINILCLNTSVFAQLTQTDLDKINDLILASEKRMKEYVDIKIDALDKKLTGQINALDAKLTGEIRTVREEIKTLDAKLTGEIKTVDGRVSLANVFVVVLIALIAVAVGLPQYLSLVQIIKKYGILAQLCIY